MSGIRDAGIQLSPVSGETSGNGSALVTGNTWDHVLITGNTISGSAAGPLLGIDLELGQTIGDTLQHTIVANNNIVVPMPGAGGIAINVGYSPGSNNNQALDTLIANNDISAVLPQFGIRIGEGLDSAWRT